MGPSNASLRLQPLLHLCPRLDVGDAILDAVDHDFRADVNRSAVETLGGNLIAVPADEVRDLTGLRRGNGRYDLRGMALEQEALVYDIVFSRLRGPPCHSCRCEYGANKPRRESSYHLCAD